MILVDTNLLIYAHMDEAPEHDRAHAWLDQTITNGTRVGMPWVSLLAFFRVTTNRRAFANPQTMAGAWAQVHAWLASPSVWIPEPTERHVDVFGDLLLNATISANLTTDAHLAALAIEHGLILYTNDRDFSRFSNLKWINPLKQ